MHWIISNSLVTNGRFQISSGDYVDSYIDLYKILCNPALRIRLRMDLDKFLFERNLHKPISFAGRETAGALVAMNQAVGGNIIVVRARQRDHGTENELELGTPTYRSVVLFDDVTSTGISMKDSVEKLRRGNFNVLAAVSVVYRGMGAEEVAKGLKVPFHYVVRYDE
jgi:orotate phosphoribosyltransferase